MDYKVTGYFTGYTVEYRLNGKLERRQKRYEKTHNSCVDGRSADDQSDRMSEEYTEARKYCRVR